MAVMDGRLTCERVASQIEALHGNVSAVARDLGVSRPTLYAFIQRHPTLQSALREAREAMLDNAESALYRAVLAGKAWAVCFFLKTQGKGRGYIERAEVAGVPTAPLVVNLVRRSTDSDNSGGHDEAVIASASATRV